MATRAEILLHGPAEFSKLYGSYPHRDLNKLMVTMWKETPITAPDGTTKITTTLDPAMVQYKNELLAECREYDAALEKYLNDRIYDEVGWEALDNEAQPHYQPCGGASHQCSWECPVFDICEAKARERKEREAQYD